MPIVKCPRCDKNLKSTEILKPGSKGLQICDECRTKHIDSMRKEILTLSNAPEINVSAIIQRGMEALENEYWDLAVDYFNLVLDADANNAQAYVCLFMCDTHTCDMESLRLAYVNGDFVNNMNFNRAKRFAYSSLSMTLEQWEADRRHRIENENAIAAKKAALEKMAEERKKAEAEKEHIAFIEREKKRKQEAEEKKEKQEQSILEVRNALVDAINELDFDEEQIVPFGLMKKSNNDPDATPMRWLIVDKKGNDLILIAKDPLLLRRYDATAMGECSWETCELRKWLNKNFFLMAFSDAERQLISDTRVSNAGINGTRYTIDRMYLLSAEEAKEYFPTDRERKLYKENGVPVGWWLRTKGFYDNLTSIVTTSGAVDDFGSDCSSANCAVRPVITVNLAPIVNND